MTSKPKIATTIPPEITTPDKVETRLGTLKFFDGFPDAAAEKCGAMEGGADYVPPAERVATFDNDGTRWCEQPVI
jgi:hypothetical protein